MKTLFAKIRRGAAWLLLPLLFAAGGCAPKNWNTEEDGAFDPWEGLNRETYKLNKGLDFLVLKPVARAYSYMPAPIRTGVDNVFANLGEPSNAVNNALQNNGDATVESTARFAINTVFGIGGLFDVASALDIQRHETDLGQTLRGYGMRDTMFVMLPVLGPTTIVDGLGRGGDGAITPQSYMDNDSARAAVYGANAVHVRADLLEAGELAEDIALDEYQFVRDAYETRRLQKTPDETWADVVPVKMWRDN